MYGYGLTEIAEVAENADFRANTDLTDKTDEGFFRVKESQIVL